MTTTHDLFDLSGRVAVVTGGGTHLGRAMATALGEMGAVVYIASRRKKLCEQVATDLRDAGIDCMGLGCDVTVESDVDALVKSVVDDRGQLDIMVCNAGGSSTTTYIPDADIEEFRNTLDTNVTSTYLCAQAAARVMIPKRSGSIITLGSIHGFLSNDKRFYDGFDFKRSGPPYQAAKGAVINLTKSLAAELGEYGVTVNCLSPGQIPQEGTPSQMVLRARESQPLRRTGRPDDVKGAVVLLASPAGGWITGQNLVVDGGWSIW